MTPGDTLTFNAAATWRPRNPLTFAPPKVSSPVEDPLTNGDWPIVRQRLLEVIYRFPDAHKAVVDALRELNQLPPIYNTEPRP